MKEKLLYESPEVDIVNLSMEGTILEGSNVDATGQDVTFFDPATFESIFM